MDEIDRTTPPEGGYDEQRARLTSSDNVPLELGRRVRLRSSNPMVGDALGTIVDVGQRGAVIDWDSGIRNYIEFAALDPVDP